MSRRITALERAFNKTIQPEKVSFHDTRRKGIAIASGEIPPGEPQPITPYRKELIKEVMEKLDKVRGQ